MKFKLILKVDKPVNCYNGTLIETGDVIELNEHFSEKALNNPNYEFVKPVVCQEIIQTTKKKVTKKTTKKVIK